MPATTKSRVRTDSPCKLTRWGEDDLNLYAYVRNDPLNATDPSGRQEFSFRRMAEDLHRAMFGPAPRHSAEAARAVADSYVVNSEVPLAALSEALNSPPGIVASAHLPGVPPERILGEPY